VRIRGRRGMLFESVWSLCCVVARDWSHLLVLVKHRGHVVG
jgi:hypothetical protein